MSAIGIVGLRANDVPRTLEGAAPLEPRHFSGGVAGVFRSETGVSPWDFHPDGEEMLHVLDGWVEIENARPDGTIEVFEPKAGSVLTVPRIALHRHIVHASSVDVYATTGRSLVCHARDPQLVRD